jgi:peptidoglycan/xylan/chitin deacetylase (PgdA/CDA1 family)
MPFKVRLQIILAVLLVALVSFALFQMHFILGALFSVAALLYIEMIYPKWNFFGSCILHMKDPRRKNLALTFDDGPSPWTPAILDALKAENIQATFFLLGMNVARHPEIARRIESEGHAIGYHGHTHTKFHFKSPSFIREDLNKCIGAFQKARLAPSKLIRFPHGFKNIFAVREIKKRNLHLCGWGRGVWDSKRPGVKTIVSRSLQIKSGEILLLHDGDGIKENPDRSQTAEALPEILRELKARGFEFSKLDY